MTDRHSLLVEALQTLIESAAQATCDFCGDQRSFHLPRLTKSSATLMTLFPAETFEAMAEAKDPYGDLLYPEDQS